MEGTCGVREPRSPPTTARRSSQPLPMLPTGSEPELGTVRDAKPSSSRARLIGTALCSQVVVGGCWRMRWGTGLPLGEHPGIQLAPGQLQLLVKPLRMALHVGSTTMTWALTSVGKESKPRCLMVTLPPTCVSWEVRLCCTSREGASPFGGKILSMMWSFTC